MRTCRQLPLFAFLLFLVGCAAKPQDLLVGKWETTDFTGKVQVAEFSKDGTCSLPVPLLNIRIDGKYKFLTDDQIEIDLPNHNRKYKVVVTKETLTLTETDAKTENGKSQIFKRAK